MPKSLSLLLELLSLLHVFSFLLRFGAGFFGFDDDLEVGFADFFDFFPIVCGCYLVS